ncbi:MAG: hypothetical protein U0Q18_32430 [Bryobacteraceae bacterium]
MAYIPSEKVAEGLALAATGLWVDRLADGRIALVAKVPESVIKALFRGATASLFVGSMMGDWLRILCLGLRVNDEPQNPFTVTMPNCSPQDSALLKEVFSLKSTTLHCMNELNHPVLSAWCDLEVDISRRAAEWLETSDHWLLTLDFDLDPAEVTRNLELALDHFQHHIYPPRPPDSEVFELPLSLRLWPTQIVFDCGEDLQEGFSIDDTAEGTKLERAIHTIVNAMYRGNAFRSPLVDKGGKRRELTDVLGFNESSICVIQAKALSVFAVDTDRSSDRRAASVTKDITKALKQLEGALRQIRLGSAIYDSEGAQIVIPDTANSIAHGIVVLSEMYSFVDWKAVAADVLEASENEATKALFHVMDIQEFANIQQSCTSVEGFGNMMVQRWVWVKHKGTAYGRARKRRPGNPPPSEWFK